MNLDFLDPFSAPQPSEIAWMVDDSVDSFVNLELRKTDLESYVFGEEGNIWTNLFGKVEKMLLEELFF